jgi:hypothetical protein
MYILQLFLGGIWEGERKIAIRKILKFSKVQMWL